ncbi:hypothetical protein TrST_g1697 [Triparma strigata]|uniref:Methylenetetrahydrofolate reductase (NAD(P)H) n=1 Tax=Triparma strigata TaxID=1606541 RepID=A0A9W7DWE2_9STRA|nr:hypothetical protein TrST_g1697 [Triparma strigata]
MSGHLSSACRKEAIVRFMQDFSVEVTPRQAARLPSFENLPGLRHGTRVNVASLPGADHGECIDTCRRLWAAGLRPVAHVPVRAFPSLQRLDEHLARLRMVGVEDVLALAGSTDPTTPTKDGALHEAMQLLGSGLIDDHGFRSVAVAGHPEGHPTVPAAALEKAALRKAQWWWSALEEADGAIMTAPDPAAPPASLHFETQFCFDAAPIVAWEQTLRRRLQTALQAKTNTPSSLLPLPSIRVGVAGPAKLPDLLRFAKISGVGASALHQLRNSKSNNSSSSSSPTFPATPDRVIAGVAEHQLLLQQTGVPDSRAGTPSCLFRGVHFYSFGGFAATLRWASAVERGDFDLRECGGGGFEVRGLK